MANVDEVFDDFPEDHEPEISDIIAGMEKHEGMTMMEQREEVERPESGKERCWLAMKAAWDTLAEYCGGSGVPMEIAGMSLTVPVDVTEMVRTHPEMSRDERIKMIADTKWCKDTALEMCQTLFGAAHLECIESVAERIASKIVG